MTIAEWIVYLAMIYVAIGVLFAVAFIVFGVGRIDSAAKGAPITFRLLILPGAAALWPVLLKSWLRGSAQPPVENNPHRHAVQEGMQ